MALAVSSERRPGLDAVDAPCPWLAKGDTVTGLVDCNRLCKAKAFQELSTRLTRLSRLNTERGSRTESGRAGAIKIGKGFLTSKA